MEITRTSKLTGTTRTLVLPVTQAQIDLWLNGAFIQDAMPHLTSDEREFVMTGITQEEWDAAFGDEE